jgi:hypothetical protein
VFLVLFFEMMLLLLVIGTSVWVGFDSGTLMKGLTLEQRREIGGGRSPAEWVVGCILIWIIAFPWYLSKRCRYKQAQLRLMHAQIAGRLTSACSACGKECPTSASFCQHCGRDLREAPASIFKTRDGEAIIYCSRCGAANNPSWFYCLECRQPLDVGQTVPRTARPDDTSLTHLLLPVDVSKLAFWAGYVGLLAIAAYPAPLALLLGILAIRDLRRHPGKRGMGRAVFAIVMGSIGMVILLLLVMAPRLAHRAN